MYLFVYLRGHTWVHFAHSVLLPWIQTLLSYKPEIVFNDYSKRIIWAYIFAEKDNGFLLFLNMFLRKPIFE